MNIEIPLDELQSFLAVSSNPNLSQAARSLGIATSTLSRRITRLEQSLDTDLLQRSGRGLVLTDAGRSLAEHCGPSLQDLRAAIEAAREQAQDVYGTLRISAPTELGSTPAFAELLALFKRAHPRVSLQVELTNRVVSLVDEGFDLVLRAHHKALDLPKSLGTVWLGRSDGALYCSESYACDQPPPQHPKELLSHRLIGHDALTRSGLTLHRDQETIHLAYPSETISNDFRLVAALIAQGMGIGFLPLAASPISQGSSIVRVLEDWSVPGGDLSLIWPERRYLLPRVRRFIDLARGWGAQLPGMELMPAE